MKERPILFSGPMVRAILEDRKTKTRRLPGLEEINSYPGSLVGISARPDILGREFGYQGLCPNDYYIAEKYKRDYRDNPGIYHWFIGSQGKNTLDVIPVKCPYGGVGDRLWVRETWATPGNYDHIKPSELTKSLWFEIIYRANERYPLYYHWRPSIFMPRWASRILLEVISVRVERLQDITDDDAKAEGMTAWHDTANGTVYRPEFELLWQSINGKTSGHSWNDNPWVWVIEFRKA